MYCDREFKSLLQDAWEQLEITINYTNTKDHVGEAERNNRFLKERFRTKFHYLLYKAMPRIMIKGLATQVARQANYFPVKGGVSSILSPCQLIEQKYLEFHKYLGILFGSYVEAAQKTTNTAKARTRSAIYLGVSSNIQGGHEVMALDTGFEVSTQTVTKLPISDVVIKRVEELAKNQGFKVLKFANRRGQPIFRARASVVGY